MIRLPYKSQRSNGQCWANTMKKVAGYIDNQVGALWTWEVFHTVPNTNYMRDWRSQEQDFPAYHHCATISLFFNPTDANWECLISETPTLHPFDHRCHRGHQRNNVTIDCINGVEHGTFSTKAINEERKVCSDRCLAMCHGHGVGGSCIYMHESTGQIQKCRMVADCLPKCECALKCY